MNPASKKYVLVTGATGLVGRFLIRDLLLNGTRLALVVRPTERLSAVQRVEAILQSWERELDTLLPRPIVLCGDIKQNSLGLEKSDINWVKENCDSLIHNAAVLKFHGTDRGAEPWQTNYFGSKNVVDFAKANGIDNWHYVSTAYVCGKQDQPVSEDQLDTGQEFRNDYERSKFESEKMVRQAADGFAKLTVYRPAVIVGDSETGFTCSYHGLFLYLRLIATLVPQQPRDENGVIQTPITLPISGDEPRNLVTVDWVSKVICRIFDNPEAHGKTFHLSPDSYTTARQIIDYCYDYFNSSGVKYCQETNRMTDEEMSSFAAKFFENSKIYEPYQTDDPVFERKNLLQFAGDIPCPPIDKQAVFRFIEFGTNDRWGKRRERAPDVECWFGEQLMNVREFDFLDPVKKAKIGIDIHGPGGGQWQLVIDDNTRQLKRGLPTEPAATITFDAIELGKKIAAEDFQEGNFWQAVFANPAKPVSF